MSKFRRAAKRDESEPGVVKALREAGWDVYRDLPVDLLCFKRVDNLVRVKLLECKTPKGKRGDLKLRKDQQEQQAFCERYGVEYVTSPTDALLAVGEKVAIE